MKTLYLSDLDGTLLQPNVELSNETVSIINGLIDNGMLFSIATARTIASVKYILKDLNISVPIILMNGVCIFDPDKKDYIKVETFPRKSIEMLMSVIVENHLKGLAYVIKNGVMSVYYEDLSNRALYDFCKERIDRYQKKFTQIDDFTSLSGEPLIYFAMIDLWEHLEPIYHIIETIPDLSCVCYKDNYSPDLWYLETYSKTASKYHAAQFLRSYLKPDKVVCFGDNRNDFPLFEASDYKIAVGNAVPELKEKADLIIRNNYDDGVALWLKNYAEY
jgi:Cof subfamily protein (haloacid dehalogenase superfamily)